MAQRFHVMLRGGMSLKSFIIALLCVAIGYVIGLPMGALFGGASSDGADSPGQANPRGKTQRTSHASPGEKPTAEAAADNSLLAKLLAIHEGEANEGWALVWTDFDARVAKLLSGRTTSELSALAAQLAQTKRNRAPDKVLRAVFMHWARRDAGAAWQAALGALPEHRAEALAGCLLALSATDHLAALKRVDAITDESLRADAKKILDENASRVWQAELLVRRLVAMPESDRPKDLLKNAINSWATHHLRAALDFVKTLPQTDREKMLPDFCNALALVDVEEAKRLASDIQDPKLSARAWRAVVGGISMTNPELATAFMETLPLEQMEPEFFERGIITTTIPADAAGRIAARLTGKSRENYLADAFRRAYLMSGHQLQAQLDAIELLPEDGRAIEPVVRRLMRFTPDSALAWADALPESPLRDHVIAEASDGVAERERERALQMAAGIQDEKLRVKTMNSRVESWLQNDRTAAIAWLKSAQANQLPADDRARWLKLSGAK